MDVERTGPLGLGVSRTVFVGLSNYSDALSDDAFVRSIALQDGGEVLLAGWMRSSSTFRTDCAIARLSTSGQLDTTFATGGKLLVDFFGADDGAFTIAPQDGRMVVAGLAMSGSTRLAALLRLSL